MACYGAGAWYVWSVYLQNLIFRFQPMIRSVLGATCVHEIVDEWNQSVRGVVAFFSVKTWVENCVSPTSFSKSHMAELRWCMAVLAKDARLRADLNVVRSKNKQQTTQSQGCCNCQMRSPPSSSDLDLLPWLSCARPHPSLPTIATRAHIVPRSQWHDNVSSYETMGHFVEWHWQPKDPDDFFD